MQFAVGLITGITIGILGVIIWALAVAQIDKEE